MLKGSGSSQDTNSNYRVNQKRFISTDKKKSGSAIGSSASISPNNNNNPATNNGADRGEHTPHQLPAPLRAASENLNIFQQKPAMNQVPIKRSASQDSNINNHIVAHQGHSRANSVSSSSSSASHGESEHTPHTNSTSNGPTNGHGDSASNAISPDGTPKLRVVVSMKTFWARLASFVNGERLWIKTQPSAQSLALAGFYFSPNERHPDRATCHSCALSFTNWRPSDEPWALHAKYNKRCNKQCTFVESKPARLPLPSYVKQMDLVGIAEELEVMEVEALSASKGNSSVTPLQIKSKLDYFVRINAKIFNARPDLKKHTDELASFLEAQQNQPGGTASTNQRPLSGNISLNTQNNATHSSLNTSNNHQASASAQSSASSQPTSPHKPTPNDDPLKSSGTNGTKKKTKSSSKDTKLSKSGSKDLALEVARDAKKHMKKEKQRRKKEKREKAKKDKEEKKQLSKSDKKASKKSKEKSGHDKKSSSGKYQAVNVADADDDIKGVIGEYVVDVNSAEFEAKKMEDLLKQDYDEGIGPGNYITNAITESGPLDTSQNGSHTSEDDDDDSDSSSSSDSEKDEPPLSARGHSRSGSNILTDSGYKEIEFSELILEERIGFGTFCIVWKGLWRGGPVAVKILKEVDLFHRKVTQEFRREAHTMAHIGNHPNVVKFVGVSCTDMQLCIVSEYCQYGSLQGLLRGPKAMELSLKTLAGIARDAAAGVLHLHCEGVIHRDIAARNVMVGPNFVAQVGDFGFSRIIEKDASHGVTGTIGPIKHMAPEAILERVYSEKSDAFAFGCLLWEMVARKEPYDDIKSLLDVGLKVIRGMRLTIPRDTPPVWADIMRQCWETDPEKRPHMSAVFISLRNYHASLQ